MKVWVCSNCGTPIEPVFAQHFDDNYGFRCPGDDLNCSPREDRELLTEGQVEAVEIDATPRKKVVLEDESGARLDWDAALAACKARRVTIDYNRPPHEDPNATTVKIKDPVELRLRDDSGGVLAQKVVERGEQVKAMREMLSEHDLLAPPAVSVRG